DRRVRYRVVGASEWLDNNIDNNERRTTVMPMMAVDLSPGTTLSFDVEYYDQSGRNYRHAGPATADTSPRDFSKIPWDLSIASHETGWTGWNVAPGARLDMSLGRRASLHSSFRYTGIHGDLDLEALLGIEADGHTLDRYHYREISAWGETQSDSFVTSAVRTGL